MRRFAVAFAMLAFLAGTRASADPFENLSQRLEQYDQQVQSRARSGSRSSAPVQQAQAQMRPAAQSRPPARMRRPARMASMQSAPQQAAPMVEEVQPVPMMDPGYQEYYPGDMWEEPMGCASGYCGGGGDCGWFPPGFFGRAEYIAFWVRGANTPPLVTTSPPGTPVGSAGVLPNAEILFGDERINTAGRSGGRFTLGYWFDPCESLAIENSFFFLGNGDESYAASSSGSPILARPLFNVDTDAQDALLLAYPEIVVGSVNVTSSRTVYSNDLRLRRALYADCCRRVDILAGYRYFRIAEGLDIRTNTTTIAGGEVPVGTNSAVEDLFNTRNNFNGGELGVNWQMTRGCWTFDVFAAVALGGVSQRVRINGSTVVQAPGEDPLTYEGGILALDSNIGQYDRTVFGVLPELQLNLRYQWTPLWRLNFGYTFMALTNVVRPGDQIDLQVDPNQFPPGTSGTFPQFAFNNSDIWVQGINFGIETNF
ncbi:MAG: hypothetical protein DWQ37_16580 [Planctomycetota bacterium]|nr:MAG: hypothetical protein DWQ37_16580 [Planctomycetota bacterium]